MRIHTTKPLFAWECLEDSPSLKTISDFLQTIPDRRLLEALAAARGRGRDDYPVGVLWAVVLLTALLRHTSIVACLGELKRNPALRELIGIEGESRVPTKWSVCRFLVLLGRVEHLQLLHEIFDTLVQRLGQAVGDLGLHTAGDASALRGRVGRGAAADDGELPGPTGGRKEYTDDKGKVVKVVEWFGYKFHLLVDTRHEVALAYRITPANVADSTVLPQLLADAQRNLPGGRIKTLAYDMACDNNTVHELLDEAHIAPLIDNRSLWSQEHERKLPGHDGTSNVVYDESGTVYCYDMTSDPPVRHAMAYIGHERSRGTLKYRCPAVHGGYTCPNHARCNAGKSYGKTVRVKREIDLRRFPPIPRATKQFERRYKGRTAAERLNARVKLFWGADDGNVTGAARFHAQLGAVMVVHAGLATLLASTGRWEGTLSKVSLTPVAKALQAQRQA